MPGFLERPCCNVTSTRSKLAPCPPSIVHLSSKHEQFLSVIKKDLRIHLNLPVILMGQSQSATTRAMLDSGASTIFLSEAFVRCHNVITTRLPSPIPLRNADGSCNAIGEITKEAHLTMRVGTHQEKIVAAIANTGEDDLILGIDWLRHHNPEINWEMGDVHFT